MKQFYCSVFGHDFEIKKHVTYHVKEYACKHCKTELTNNGKGGYTRLTPKFKEINSVLERIHNRRLEKRKQQQEVKLIQKVHSIPEPLIEFDLPRA